jgi:hypothetical protein
MNADSGPKCLACSVDAAMYFSHEQGFQVVDFHACTQPKLQCGADLPGDLRTS